MNAKQVSFDVSREGKNIIMKIVERASGNLDLAMDLTACHANGCPLRLSELLAADDFNFWHDVRGISRHINRETGKMTRGFLPRFYRPTIATAKGNK